MCAMGVIHRAYAKEVGINYQSLPEDWITKAEAREVLHANDNLGWDFLTIARKIGNQEEV
jgi:hypothetical protein